MDQGEEILLSQLPYRHLSGLLPERPSQGFCSGFALIPSWTPNTCRRGAIDDVIPDRHYRREEVLAYLAKIKQKARTLILNTPGDLVGKVWIDESDIRLHLGCPRLVSKYSILEILFYNLRHVQHHVGQLNLILRQQIDRAPEWVSHAE